MGEVYVPTGKQTWEGFCGQMRLGYSDVLNPEYNAELYGDRLVKFNNAVKYLESIGVMQNIVNNTEGYCIFSVESDGYRYSVDFSKAKSLTVEKLGSGYAEKGYIRELFDLVARLKNVKGEKGMHYCAGCKKEHKKYGIELEFNFINDKVYRDVLLRKLNKKMDIIHGSDTYGIDGGGSAFELRNINGNTADEVVERLGKSLKHFKDNVPFMVENMPHFKFDFNTICCGTHIHMFHPGVPREKVAAAHSIVSVLVNSFSDRDWNERVSHGYGVPFSYRSPVPWCNSDFSTELRCLNSLPPKIIKFSIEAMEEILQNDFKLNRQEYERFVAILGLNSHTICSKVNSIVAFMVEKKVVKFGQLKRMLKFLNNNYEGLDRYMGYKR